jgi:microsomal dipeptidase-like Zn-dependent dipeptidase
MRFQPVRTRRDFLAAIVGTGAVMALRSRWVVADDEVDHRVAELVASTLGIDTHNHIDVPLMAAEVPGPNLDLAGELKRSGLSAICATFSVDRPNLTGPGEAYERFQNAMKAMDAQLARNGMQRALNLSDLKAAHEKRQPIVVQAVEGGHFVEDKPERVEHAYKQGLRVLGLLHDNDTSPPMGDIYTNPPRHGGLTELGARVINECNRLGILVDLTHASAETVAAALKVSTRPVVFSHTGLKSADASGGPGQGMQARLITREHAKSIADAGGVVGVWTHMGNSPADYVRAIRDMVDAAGIDHVCLGTDTKLTPGGRMGGPGGPGGGPGGPAQKKAGDPAQKKAGDAAQKKAGGPGGGRMGGGSTNQAWAYQKLGFYTVVVGEMLKQGFKDDEIVKIGGGNFCRVFDAATSV